LRGADVRSESPGLLGPTIGRPQPEEGPVRRLIIVTILVALTAASPAAAITNGSPDSERHPNVGGLVSETQYPDGTWLYCSGTPISPTVFLTAAHCVGDGTRVGITFDTAYEDGHRVYYGTFEADPLYNQAQSNPHDIAVVVLDKPVRRIRPAPLPPADSLSSVAGTQTFTSVGYGAYEVTNGPGGHQYLYKDVRMMAAGTLSATNASWLCISMNPSTGNGGTCYGDSGGPNFLGTTQTLAAITIRLPRDQRRVQAGHGVGSDLPRAVRRASVTPT
jgi:secreted trypsin-like serine protease